MRRLAAPGTPGERSSVVVGTPVSPKKPAAHAEQDRDEVDLHLVELVRVEQCLRGPGTVHQHPRSPAAARTCSAPATTSVKNLVFLVRCPGAAGLAGQHEDGHPVVVVALPAASKVRRPDPTAPVSTASR